MGFGGNDGALSPLARISGDDFLTFLSMFGMDAVRECCCCVGDSRAGSPFSGSRKAGVIDVSEYVAGTGFRCTPCLSGS